MQYLTTINRDNHAWYDAFLPVSIREAYLADEHIALLGINEDDTACGAIALRLCRPEAELLWIFLAESHRGRGLATLAMLDLTHDLRDEDYERLIASEPPSKETTGEFEELMSFFPHTVQEQEASVVYSTVEELLRIKDFAGPESASVPLSQVSSVTLHELEQAAIESDNDLIPMPIRREDYLQDLSAVCMENGVPSGILLVSRTSPQVLTLAYLYSTSSSPNTALDMVRFFLRRAGELPGRHFLRMNLVNPGLLGFLRDRAHVEVRAGRTYTIDLRYIDRIRREVAVRREMANIAES